MARAPLLVGFLLLAMLVMAPAINSQATSTESESDSESPQQSSAAAAAPQEDAPEESEGAPTGAPSGSAGTAKAEAGAPKAKAASPSSSEETDDAPSPAEPVDEEDDEAFPPDAAFPPDGPIDPSEGLTTEEEDGFSGESSPIWAPAYAPGPAVADSGASVTRSRLVAVVLFLAAVSAMVAL